MQRVPILYDDDCRFCRAALALLLTWDRNGLLQPVAIQSKEGARLLAAIPEEERLAAAHAVVPGESGLVSGGAAAGPVLRLLPAGAFLADLADRVPGVSDRGYRWVAENRNRLSRLIPVALKDRADAIVCERSGSGFTPSAGAQARDGKVTRQRHQIARAVTPSLPADAASADRESGRSRDPP